VLKTVPYKERSTIVTLFTKEEGKKTCILFGSTLQKKQLASPLCHAEAVLKPGRGMDTISDGSILSLQLHLRSSLHHLEAAGKIATLLYKSQLENKPAPSLFMLTIRILEKLPEYDTDSMHACFLTKFLIHEGAFSYSHPDNRFTTEEWKTLIDIARAKQFSELPKKVPAQTIKKLSGWASTLYE